MDTMVTSTERLTKKGIGVGGGPKGKNGRPPRNGSGGDGGRGYQGREEPQGFSPARYKIAMWVALASIAMLFTGLTSAYIVRASVGDDWRPLSMPRILWLSTALIILSSLSFELARKALKKQRERAYGGWLLLTVMLGLGFLALQFAAWRQLVSEGIYIASNPHSSFFYLLTGAHGVHLIGGIIALDFLLFRTWRKQKGEFAQEKRLAIADTVALYWHFMDGLWVYLFLLLFLWR